MMGFVPENGAMAQEYVIEAGQIMFFPKGKYNAKRNRIRG